MIKQDLQCQNVKCVSNLAIDYKLLHYNYVHIYTQLL